MSSIFSSATASLFSTLISLLVSTSNRFYIGFFGLVMFPLLAVAISFYIVGIILFPPVDIMVSENLFQVLYYMVII
jgi:hypothetical protein